MGDTESVLKERGRESESALALAGLPPSTLLIAGRTHVHRFGLYSQYVELNFPTGSIRDTAHMLRASALYVRVSQT